MLLYYNTLINTRVTVAEETKALDKPKPINEHYVCSYSGYIVGITILLITTTALAISLSWMIFRNEAYLKVRVRT